MACSGGLFRHGPSSVGESPRPLPIRVVSAPVPRLASDSSCAPAAMACGPHLAACRGTCTCAIQCSLERDGLRPRLPVSAAHKAWPRRGLHPCQRASSLPGQGLLASGTHRDRTWAKWHGPAAPLDRGGWKRRCHLTDPFLQTSSLPLPARILFPVAGSSLEGMGDGIMFTGCLFCRPAAERGFLPLE